MSALPARSASLCSSLPVALIALPLAKAGLQVTGIDRSEAMLTIARCKLAALPAPVQGRLTLINQDMSTLNLGQRFGFVFVPFRSFQALLTIDLQRKSLEAIRRHLEPTGRLALHLFDPRLDLLTGPSVTVPGHSGTHLRLGAAMWVRFSDARARRSRSPDDRGRHLYRFPRRPLSPAITVLTSSTLFSRPGLLNATLTPEERARIAGCKIS
jgi:SAM-dependent methyltransferase